MTIYASLQDKRFHLMKCQSSYYVFNKIDKIFTYEKRSDTISISTKLDIENNSTQK